MSTVWPTADAGRVRLVRVVGAARVVGAVALLSFVLAGCSTTQGPVLQSPPGPRASTSTLTPTPDAPTSTSSAVTNPAQAAAAAAALDTYTKFFTYALAAQLDPEASLRSTTSTGPTDFRAYALDPIRGQYDAYLLTLAQQKVAYKGTPPRPRASVISVDLAAKPYPKVVVTNCPTPSTDWRSYSMTSGAEAVEATPSVPPPYLSTSEVILCQGRWGVTTLKVDGSATCSA